MKRIIYLCLLMLSMQLATAQKIESFNRHHQGGYNYWLYTPKNTEVADSDSVSALKPLVIFLHGQSLTGNNLDKVLRYGPIDAIRRGRDIDAYILAPQNPGGAWNPDEVFHIVDSISTRYAIDQNRIYVLGMSLGGYGTINTVAAYPDRIAAAMALCGGGVNPDYSALHEVPLWIMHGTADRAVSVKESDKVVEGMKKIGEPERLTYSRIPNFNHSILARTFYMPQTYDWLFSHSLADSARTINRDFAINEADFKTAYKGISRTSKSTVPIIKHHSSSSSSKSTANSTSKSSSSSAAAGTIHTVKKGDTLSGIAKKYHTTVAKICSLNGITTKSTLRIGQKIRVK